MMCILPYRGLSGGNQEWSWGALQFGRVMDQSHSNKETHILIHKL
jgi:hypothetical protein